MQLSQWILFQRRDVMKGYALCVLVAKLAFSLDE